MFLLKFALCNNKKWKWIKEQEASGLLISLGVKTSLSKIHLFGSLCFSGINNLIQDINEMK